MLRHIVTLVLTFINATGVAWALDCRPPAPHTEVRLYLGSEYDSSDDNIVPGQNIQPPTTCALGTVFDATREPQWKDVEMAWAPYEALMLPILIPHSNPSGLKAEGFHIGRIAYVTLSRDYTDHAEAAIGLADLVMYASQKEGGGPVARYDILTWSSHQVSERLVVVYDDGQIVTVKVDAWRDACRTQEFTLSRIDDTLYPDYQLTVTGMEDICSVIFRELASAE